MGDYEWAVASSNEKLRRTLLAEIDLIGSQMLDHSCFTRSVCGNNDCRIFHAILKVVREVEP